jgi:hypothetical protein
MLNRTTGVAMSLIKKVDVKKHLAERRAMRLAAAKLVSRPDTVGSPETIPTKTRKNHPGFVDDFFLEHTTSIVSVTSTD